MALSPSFYQATTLILGLLPLSLFSEFFLLLSLHFLLSGKHITPPRRRVEGESLGHLAEYYITKCNEFDESKLTKRNYGDSSKSLQRLIKLNYSGISRMNPPALAFG